MEYRNGKLIFNEQGDKEKLRRLLKQNKVDAVNVWGDRLSDMLNERCWIE